jgi:hypothetical protein
MKYAVAKAKIYYSNIDTKSHTEWVPTDPKVGQLCYLYDEETDTITEQSLIQTLDPSRKD